MSDVPVKIKLEGQDEVISELKKLGAVIVGALAFEKIIEFGKRGVEEFQNVALASAKLTTALGFESKGLEDLAKHTALNTTFKKDEIIAAQGTLAIYTKNEAAVRKLTPALLDMAAGGRGLTFATRQMKQALEGAHGTAKLFGETLAGSANSTERYNSILEVTNRHVGGQAEAAGAALGPLGQLSKVQDEMAEALVTGIMPGLQQFAGWVVSNAPKVEGFLSALGTGFEEIATNHGVWVVAIGAISTALTMAFISNPVGAALAAIGAGIVLVSEALGKAKEKAVSAAKETFKGMDSVQIGNRIEQLKKDEIAWRKSKADSFTSEQQQQADANLKRIQQEK